MITETNLLQTRLERLERVVHALDRELKVFRARHEPAEPPPEWSERTERERAERERDEARDWTAFLEAHLAGSLQGSATLVVARTHYAAQRKDGKEGA